MKNLETGVSPMVESPTLEQQKQIPIQEQANYKGNYSKLLFSRLQNPTIKGQILDMYGKNEQSVAERSARNNQKYTVKTPQEFEQEYDEALRKQMSVTNIDPTRNPAESYAKSISFQKDYSAPNNRDAFIGIKKDDPSRPLTEDELRNLSVTEAHEKGHVFRHMKASEFLINRFSAGFDKTKASPESQFLFDYSDPAELIERMSQLKGYFGMKGDEKFTPQHLEYAREHYLKDGMLDNQIGDLFRAITPETEFAFLKLMNSSGI